MPSFLCNPELQLRRRSLLLSALVHYHDMPAQNWAAQAFDIHSRWCRQSFVEVVNIKNDIPFRRRERTEIHQVAIATSLYFHFGVWRV